MTMSEFADELTYIAVDVMGLDLSWWEKIKEAFRRGGELGRALVLGPEEGIA